MKKSFYGIVSLLVWTACSDNVSPISGSTSIPNMENNLNVPQSPVLCSVIGVTDSLEALEKGCIWSPEMWGPTTGYRVRTGYDNGTNTSGIWIWHTEGNFRFEWPGEAKDEYDSMALADVIDKCGGSLCGKVVYESNKNGVDSDEAYVGYYESAYLEFYFAGKDAFGNVEETDVSAIQGICVEYSGYFSELELLPNDSIVDLNKFPGQRYEYVYSLRDLQDSDASLPKTKERCFPWSSFAMVGSIYGDEVHKMVFVPNEDVVAHLKGVRFKFSRDTEFNIVSIGRYHLAYAPTTNFHPADETCEPIEVTSTFCDCDFSEEKAVSLIKGGNYHHFLDMKLQVEDSLSLSNSTKECFESTLDSLRRLFDLDEFYPCDNPLPQIFACADGTISLSLEYVEKREAFTKMSTPISEKMRAATDSLFNYCMSLSN